VQIKKPWLAVVYIIGSGVLAGTDTIGGAAQVAAGKGGPQIFHRHYASDQKSAPMCVYYAPTE